MDAGYLAEVESKTQMDVQQMHRCARKPCFLKNFPVDERFLFPPVFQKRT